MTIVAIDLGSTEGRFAIEDGYVNGVPAAITRAKPLWQTAEDYITLHGQGDIFVGQAAIDQDLNPIYALEDNKMERVTLEPVLQAVMASICKHLGDDSPTLDVVATLPYDATPDQKEMLISMLDKISGKEIVATIGEHRISVQPTIRHKNLASEGLSGLCNYILCDDGKIIESKKDLAGGKVFVGDIGLYHFNMLACSRLTLLGTISRSTALGLSNVHLEASKYLGNVNARQVDRAILEGEYDASSAFEQFAKIINQEVRNMESRMGTKFEHYYWTGGGSKALWSWLDQKNKILADNSQMDNCLGALKIGKRKWRNHAG